jgi:hypothetical protein
MDARNHERSANETGEPVVSTGEEVSVNAADLLGAESADDWKLEPTEHAARLKPEAVALKRVLEMEFIKEIIDRYDRADKAAAEQQSRYKKFGRSEIYLGTVAAILGAIVLSMADLADPNPSYSYFRDFLLLIQIICAAGVVGVKYLLQHQQPFVKWNESRSMAETARIELFETVCGLTERKWENVQSEVGFPLLPLQLEYFVRYQLDVQLIYYDKRGEQHRKAARRYVSFGAAVTFIAALAAALVGVSQGIGDSVSIASMAALAAPILMTAQTNLSRLNQDERNGARYEITYAHLKKVRGEMLDDARSGAAVGHAAPVHAFIRAVDRVISVEHSQWQAPETSGATATA